MKSVALIVAIFLLATSHLYAEEKTTTLRTMSFNIRYGTAKDGDNVWDKRKDLVAKTIVDFNPDLLGLQESIDFQIAFVAKKLSGYSVVGSSREKDPHKGESVPILFRQDRFELIETGDFWLSETAQERGSIGWDAACPRMVTWVKLKDRTSEKGRQLIIANTHFDHRGVVARQKSAEQLRAKIDRWIGEKLPVIVLGDFNCAPGSAPHQTLLNRQALIDTFAKVHPNQTTSLSTLTGWNGKREGPRIDWILHSKEFRTIDAAINFSHDDYGRNPSDHYPVQAVLTFRD